MDPTQAAQEETPFEKKHQESYALLRARRAKEAAKDGLNSSSVDLRAKITEEFKKAFSNKAPYDWQLDVTEALLLCMDCILIAGTGAGKMMPFVMPLLADETQKKKVLIISMLNALEEDQVSD